VRETEVEQWEEMDTGEQQGLKESYSRVQEPTAASASHTIKEFKVLLSADTK